MAEIDSAGSSNSYTTDVVPSDVSHATFMGNPLIDSLFSAFTALGMEVWSIRRRAKVVESLLERRGAVTTEMIETFMASPEESAVWAADRDAFVKSLYEPFLRQAKFDYASSMHPNKTQP